MTPKLMPAMGGTMRTTLATLATRSSYSYRPEDQADQRQLLAVLSELQAI